ncbi:MAG: cytochrome C [Paracoccus sp. (in: a-proteobacteria)]|nr:cytochrome C [Paracoccus sp. (in: a-proteobacteria)]
MNSKLIVTLAAISFAAPAFAEGDPVAGEREYNKCRACHMIQDDDGNTIIQGGRTGPNMWNIIGSPLSAEEGFRYSPGAQELAEAHPDAVWDVHSLAAYLTDPNGYLQEHSGNASARSAMTFRMPDGAGKDNLIAYLLTISPDAPEQPEESDGAPLPPPEEE